MSAEPPDSKPSHKGARFLIGIAAGLVVAAVLRALLMPAPPAYGGKTIHEWWPEVRSSGADTNKPVAIAMRHMGTNALPKIYSELSVPFVPPADEWSVNWLGKLPRSWHEHLPYQFKSRSIARRSDAKMAFALLGPERTNALPELRRMVVEQGQWQAMSCLLLCGPEGVAVVLEQLQSTDVVRLHWAIGALSNFQPQSRVLIFRHVSAAETGPVYEAMRPRITALATHPDGDIRRTVASVLVHSGVEWGQPLIDQLLTDTNLSGAIQEEIKQRAWWESYRATNLPASMPAP